MKGNKEKRPDYFKDPHPNCKRILGDHAGGVPPVPIPNTEVKPSRADVTAVVRLWESR